MKSRLLQVGILGAFLCVSACGGGGCGGDDDDSSGSSSGGTSSSSSAGSVSSGGGSSSAKESSSSAAAATSTEAASSSTSAQGATSSEQGSSSSAAATSSSATQGATSGASAGGSTSASAGGSTSASASGSSSRGGASSGAAAACGNGVLERGEQCDPPDGTACDANCQTIAVTACGNGVVDSGEECDPPVRNVCDDLCQRIPRCGDSFVDNPETCDPPDGTTCSATCALIRTDVETLCGNFQDEDSDGVYDCGDPTDCQGSAACLPGTTPHGGPCRVPSDCVASGDDPACITEELGYPSGYCSEWCKVSTDDCGRDSLCRSAGTADPDLGVCYLTCDPASATPCAAGYACLDSGDGLNSVCLPSCTADEQCPATGHCDPTTGACVVVPVCGNGVLESGEQCEPPATAACDATCQVIAPAGWTCPAAYYGTRDGCDCGCGLLDPDCADATAASCEFCNGRGGCNGANDCPGVIDPANNAACTATTCGDGAVQGLEQCDPPNGTTCDANCVVVAQCGNGAVERGETCDPPDDVNCDSACQVIPAVCGDSLVQAGEQCDPPAVGRCTAACQFDAPAGWTCNAAYYGTNDGCDCGCGLLDPDCTDATAASCEYCGNRGNCNGTSGCPGLIDDANNAICNGSLCGDTAVQPGETCDPPDGTTCDGTCQLIVPTAWTCDPAYYGTSDGCDCGCGALDRDCASATAACGYDNCAAPAVADPADNTQCVQPVCGNSVLERGENCEPPNTATCDAACMTIPVCGNSVLERGEDCDPPNGVNCDSACHFQHPAEWTCRPGYFGHGDGCDCGCGVLDPDCPDATEASCQYNQCASGTPNAIDNAKCDLAVCGNNVLERGEDCDPPNGISCSVECRFMAPAGWTCLASWYAAQDGCDCGCGIGDPDCPDPTLASCQYGQCPAGLIVDPDDTTACIAPVCGNGAVETGEQCDPPAAGTCSETCQALAPAGWTCRASWFGTSDGCDCGCGVVDRDCPSPTAADCEYQHCDAGRPQADNNAVCTP